MLRRVVAGVLFGCVAWASLASAQQPTVLQIDSELFQNLRVLAAGLHNEVALCLHGRVEGDTAWLTSMEMRAHSTSTTDRASHANCPDSTIAWWHVHSRFRWTKVEDKSVLAVVDRSPRWFCYLSQTDVRTVLRREHPFAIVSTSKNHHCWWRLDQVTEDRVPLRPPAGQVTWKNK